MKNEYLRDAREDYDRVRNMTAAMKAQRGME